MAGAAVVAVAGRGAQRVEGGVEQAGGFGVQDPGQPHLTAVRG
nr:hypothetical protein [Micromonospora sp. DSM 115978]